MRYLKKHVSITSQSNYYFSSKRKLAPKLNIIQQEEEKTTKTGKTTILSSSKKPIETTLHLKNHGFAIPHMQLKQVF